MLAPAERLLERDGIAVRLGGRALDLLVALVERAGQIVSKRELMAHVWPDVVVDEGSLRFHMVAIRKALEEGGGRYIVNTATRGYTFVGVVQRWDVDAPARSPAAGAAHALPALATTLVGREADVDLIRASLQRQRLVSIVGPGGIGKTAVAIAAAGSAARDFGGGVRFVDLSADPEPAAALSSLAGVAGPADDLRDLLAWTATLADRNALVVLDCCEPVIARATALAETLVRACPHVQVLATSREPLRAVGELVHRLQPLAFPSHGEGTTVESAMAYPAVRLFVDRAAASVSGFELRDGDAALASQLCRELEGSALAIELAAGRIEALGLSAVTMQFDANARLTWPGRRTAVARQQSLRATLDWSLALLNEHERRFLCRLSVFAEPFSLEAAVEVCGFDFDESVAVELIANLVSKSLVTVDPGAAVVRYALSNTMKAYCWGKLCEFGDEATVSRRFAGRFGAWAQKLATHGLGPPMFDGATAPRRSLRGAGAARPGRSATDERDQDRGVSCSPGTI